MNANPEPNAPPIAVSPPTSRWFGAIPFKLMLLTIALSIAVEEFYPFSWFPMFTSLEKKTYYVYVTDGNDTRLAMTDEFGWTGDRLDNFYKQRLKKFRAQDPDRADEDSVELAARRTLERLLLIDRKRRPAGPARSLKLWRTDIVLKDDTLISKDASIATVAPNEVQGDGADVDEDDR